ncbi:MAG: IPT/TIG domain-containing protein [Solirubrobacteraceae bacterium]
MRPARHLTWLAALLAGVALIAGAHSSQARAAHHRMVNPSLIQQGEKLTGGGEVGEGLFGASVALSADGDTAVIGAPSDDGGAGAAWVFTRTGSTWTQQGAKLTGTGESGRGAFGASVALSAGGDTVLIGAPSDDGGAGAAWVFTRTGSTWTQQGAKLTGTGESGRGAFGHSVALSGDGDTALVGGPFDAGHTGAAWAFTRSTSTWTAQGAKLTGAGENGAGAFGFSVALSANGDTALIGGEGDDGSVGAAWPFTRSGSTWTAQGERLTGAGEVGAGRFGFSVALSGDGDTALIGGEGDDGSVGAAWPFTRSGSTWTAQGQKLTGRTGGNQAFFGYSVALSSDGDTALVGGHDYEDVGAAWPFTRSRSSWSQSGEQLAGGGEIGFGAFGSSVALSSGGDTALIGGQGDNDFIGAAWVFVNVARPSVVGLSRHAGPQAGGTRVRITGANLIAATGVSFGSRAATSFTVNSATSITAVSPAEPAGRVNVTVTTPNGTSATSSKDRYKFKRR